MGEDTTLFTSGFLGATFSWWVGQIVDDSFWRDNIAPGKHDKASQIPGWGRRYKVRIIGFHDQEDAKAPPEELPHYKQQISSKVCLSLDSFLM